MKKIFTWIKSFVILVFTICLTATAFPAHASITTADLDSGLTPTDLVNTLLGGGISISNVTYTGVNIAAGTFIGGTGIIAFEDGIILSSGNIADVVGPNNSDNTTTALGTPGDPDLQSLITGYTTFDATVLEFDFLPIGDEVTFQYVFTSEEYNEYTNSPYNNVFGFFVNGVNRALLPDDVTPVAINNVNGGHPNECANGIDDDGDGLIDGADPDCTTPNDNIVGENNSNSGFYINNDCSDPDGGSPCPIGIEADGLTVLLTLTAQVNAGEVNHMKLAISDAGDSILDSWVFIKAGSFKIPEDCFNGVDDDLDDLVDNDDPDCWVCGDGDLDPEEECDDGNNLDDDGCSAICELEIIEVSFDIKPGSCPNPFNLKKKGVLPVAVLGTDEFDVTTIDPETILLSREGIEAGVAPIRWSYEDVATPFEGELCDCHDLNGDGYMDLTIKFSTPELVEVLMLGEVAGETIPLTLTGNLKEEKDGTPITGEDCIRVQ